MNIKEAIILNAGMGKRLLPFTANNPKCFAEINGVSILENTLDALCEIDIKTVYIVTGYLKEKIEERVGHNYKGMQVNFVYNRDYQTTNSMYSLYLALQYVTSDVYVFEGDVFFEKNIIQGHNFSGENIVWFVDSSSRKFTGSYIEMRNDFAISQKIFSIEPPQEQKYAKSASVLYFKKDFIQEISSWLNVAISEGKSNLYYDLIFGGKISEQKNLINTLDIKGSKWVEIDTIEDWNLAKEIF